MEKQLYVKSIQAELPVLIINFLSCRTKIKGNEVLVILLELFAATLVNNFHMLLFEAISVEMRQILSTVIDKHDRIRKTLIDVTAKILFCVNLQAIEKVHCMVQVV